MAREGRSRRLAAKRAAMVKGTAPAAPAEKPKAAAKPAGKGARAAKAG